MSRLAKNTIKRHKDVFPPTHWKHILKLLGLIIVADGKVVKEELDAYLDVVVELKYLVDPTVNLTRHMAKDIFILNRSEYSQIIDSLAYDTALIEILSHIRQFPHKLDVISGMVRIAIADGDYSNIEKGLIKKTILYWNIPVKSESEADYSDPSMAKNISA